MPLRWSPIEPLKPKAYLLVFDGLADWEPAHAFCEIRKSGKFEVVTVGFSPDDVTTMAGLRIVPDVTIEHVSLASAAFFMLPGGDMWQDRPPASIGPLLHRLHDHNILIGAICAATLEIARAGLTHRVRHTSNSKEYLKSMVPRYQDEAFYVDELAVTDCNIITASGLGSVEFAREVAQRLELFNKDDLKIWFDMFKRGVVPAGML